MFRKGELNSQQDRTKPAVNPKRMAIHNPEVASFKLPCSPQYVWQEIAHKKRFLRYSRHRIAA